MYEVDKILRVLLLLFSIVIHGWSLFKKCWQWYMRYVYLLYLRRYLKQKNHISICVNDNDNIINKVQCII